MGKYRPKIGFTAGVWDFLHPGHTGHFEKCKEYCDYLIVALQIDPTIDRPEKNKPIFNFLERAMMLEANRYVDLIIPYSTEKELKKMEEWLPVDFRFRGIDHKAEEHYPTRGEFIDIDSGYNIHSSDIRKRICQQH